MRNQERLGWEVSVVHIPPVTDVLNPKNIHLSVSADNRPGIGRKRKQEQERRVWAVSVEIIEALVEYARVEGTINDQVIGEDHEDGVLLTMEPCIRVSDPHEPSVGRSSCISISLLVSDSGVSIV